MSEEVDKPKKVEYKADGSGVFDRSAHVKAMQEKAKASTHDFSKSGKKGAAISKDRARKRQEREKKLAEAKEKMFQYLPPEIKKSIDILTKATPSAAQAMVDSLTKSMEDGDVAVAGKKAEGILSLNISLADKAAKLNKQLENWVTGEKASVENTEIDSEEGSQESAVILNWNFTPKENAS